MKILAVDYGARRIGIAIADTNTAIAFPREPLTGSGNLVADAQRIARLAEEEEIDQIIVGLPLLESGEEGMQASICRNFGGELMKLRQSVRFMDERYTSVAAEASLAHLPGRKRRRVADSEAARILLSEYLSQVDAK